MIVEMLIIVLCVLGAAIGTVQADCYPGDTVYTSIVQEIYHGVTSDNIRLDSSNQPSGSINRQQLCNILTDHHNNGRNPNQQLTNKDFLGFVSVSPAACTNALTYTQGYNSILGWQQWASYHSGNWYAKSQTF